MVVIYLYFPIVFMIEKFKTKRSNGLVFGCGPGCSWVVSGVFVLGYRVVLGWFWDDPGLVSGVLLDWSLGGPKVVLEWSQGNIGWILRWLCSSPGLVL